MMSLGLPAESPTAGSLVWPELVVPAISANPALVSVPTSNVSPFAHFSQMRQVLIDSDNLFGARRVIPTVQEQVSLMQHLRQTQRGIDQQALVRVQTQYAELCGWLWQDVGDHHAAQHWMNQALSWSHQARDVELTIFILARKSQLAGDMGDGAEALSVGEAAMAMAPSRSKLAAIAATYAAHGHALLGDAVSTERAYDKAHDLLAHSDPDASHWGPWLDDPYIAVQRARSLAVLGNHPAAAAGFRTAIAALPSGYRRDHGVYLAREALALAAQQEAERAAALGLQALAIGTETASGRTLNELVRLDARLARWGAVAEVARYRNAIRATIPQRA
jgi:tetratricopeptide (TPR) repeat protein